MASKLPATIKPMLGRLVREPFDSPNHIFELKWDGMRALAFIEGRGWVVCPVNRGGSKCECHMLGLS